MGVDVAKIEHIPSKDGGTEAGRYTTGPIGRGFQAIWVSGPTGIADGFKETN
jgi:hypothetical protein